MKRDDVTVRRPEHHHVDVPSEYPLQKLGRESVTEVEPIGAARGEPRGGQVEQRADDQASGLDDPDGRRDAWILRWIVTTTGGYDLGHCRQAIEDGGPACVPEVHHEVDATKRIEDGFGQVARTGSMTMRVRKKSDFRRIAEPRQGNRWCHGRTIARPDPRDFSRLA